ncbi:MAG: 50S ribosomal protein L9 [Bacteroidetes bacterium]|jgi:large subunit ribosomal protein L9|nr:50S ribosomal protein L9 [Bacteroidota bacterium]MBK9400993.1 50S ribosomal protein L9 [Bacteroidota bacterium]MBL0097386.1 50S ribosomal protein L9 [Bacteroidota bacterium]
MEIILKQDVKNLGYADDIVKVRNGYGRNYLIPNGYAVIANDTNKKIHAEVVKQRAHKIGKLRMDADKLAAALEGVTLSIGAKVGENGKLFGSVTSQQLVDKLKSMGYAIDKKQVVMPEEHIKKTGNYTAEVIVHRDIRAKLNFEVAEG